MTIYKAIKFLRIFHDWSQEEISCKLNISQNAYGSIERGDTNINLSRLEEIANLFDMTLSEFVKFSEKKIFNEKNNTIGKNKNVLSLINSEKNNLDEYENLNKKYESQNSLFESKQIEIDLLRKINQLLDNEKKNTSKDKSSYFFLNAPFSDGNFKKRLEEKISICKRKNTNFAFFLMGFHTKKSLIYQTSIQAANTLLSQVKLRVNLLIPDVYIFTEFGYLQLLILYDYSQEEDIITVAKKTLLSLSHPYKNLHDEYFSIYSNIGISLYPKDGIDAETLKENAYIAYHSSCDQQSSSFEFFSSVLHNEMIEEQNLWKAIEQKKYKVLYQPQFKIHNGEIVSVEALLRFELGDNKFLLPNAALPIIKNHHYMIAIGEWVLHEACRQGKEWLNLGLNNIKMAVNISLVQLKNSDIYDVIKRILNEHDFPPHLLEIEIKDFKDIKNPKNFIVTFEKLLRMGVGIIMDQFHLCASQLDYLDIFPVSKVKLDTKFLNNTQSESNLTFLKSIISILKKRNIEIACVGIENKEQLNYVKSMPIDYFQGPLISQPLCAQEAQLLLISQKNKTQF